MTEPHIPRPTRTAPVAGCRNHGKLRVVVGFDDDTFAEIRAKAVRAKTSFAEQVRQLVEWGLMTDEGMQR